jgi:hypothetical protein
MTSSTASKIPIDIKTQVNPYSIANINSTTKSRIGFGSFQNSVSSDTSNQNRRFSVATTVSSAVHLTTSQQSDTQSIQLQQQNTAKEIVNNTNGGLKDNKAFELYEKFDMNTLQFKNLNRGQKQSITYPVQNLSPIKPSFAK